MNNATPLTGPVIVAAHGIYAQSATQMHNLGVMMVTDDGRAFRYAKAGATALIPGQLQQSPAEDTTNFQDLTVTAPSAGDTSITTTTSVTLTKDQLAGGLLIIADATTNAGQVCRISGHEAATAAVVTFELDDPIVYAPTGTVKVDVQPNPYNGVIVNPTTLTSAPVGVPLIKITAEYYGWLQVRGACPLLSDGGFTIGLDVVASDGTAGSAEVIADGAAELLPKVGTALTAAATTEYGLVFLKLS